MSYLLLIQIKDRSVTFIAYSCSLFMYTYAEIHILLVVMYGTTFCIV